MVFSIKKNSFFVFTNGCRRRALDTTKIINFFEANGFEKAKKVEDAEKIVFVTCSFTKSKKDESLDLIKKFKSLDGELIVVGCLPGIVPAELNKIFRGKIALTKELEKIDSFFPEFKKKFSELSDANLPRDGTVLSYPVQLHKIFFSRARLSKKFFLRCINFAIERILSMIAKESQKDYFLRTSWGCVSNCSYCGIRFSIGNIKSKPIEECVKEYKKLLHSRKKNISLIADNLGAYGLDIGLTFADLLKHIVDASKDHNVKLGISELHPIWAIKYKDALSAAIKTKKVSWLSVPLQSGSPRLLKLMNRPGNLTTLLKILNEFKKINPALEIGTHLIVGFPGETEKDIDKTIELMKKTSFDEVALYPYYDTPGTIASKMKNKISQETIEKRINKLRKEIDNLYFQ